MFSRNFRITLLLLFVAGGGAVTVGLHFENVRLQKRIAAGQQRKEQAAQLRRDNQNTQALLTRAEADDVDAARTVHDDLLRRRSEVADLEKRARERRAAMLSQTEIDTNSLEQNRDPEKGLVRLEYFSDVGRGTPREAFQTFVWAAMKGEDEKLAGMIAFAASGREKAMAIVAALPEADRLKYSTPEKLAALYFASAITSVKAVHVVGEAEIDPQHVAVRVRGLTSREQSTPMQKGPDGWQISVPEGMIAKLDGWSARKTERARQ